VLPAHTQVWSTSSLQRVKTLQGHTDAVRALAVSNGKLFSGSYDGTVRVWDVSTLQVGRRLLHARRLLQTTPPPHPHPLLGACPGSAGGAGALPPAA
jgi:WD40 repeat protein